MDSLYFVRLCVQSACASGPSWTRLDTCVTLRRYLLLQGTDLVTNGDSDRGYEAFRRVLLLDHATGERFLRRSVVSEAHFNMGVILQVSWTSPSAILA